MKNHNRHKHDAIVVSDAYQLCEGAAKPEKYKKLTRENQMKTLRKL